MSIRQPQFAGYTVLIRKLGFRSRVAFQSMGLLLIAATCQPAEREIEFNRDIRPILSDKCFACHGPDSANQQAGLRLDQRSRATAELESGATAIVPGKPGESELWRRITSKEDYEVMPPPEAKLGRLSTAEQELIRRWLEAGAEYQAHWAFLPIVAPALPAVRQESDTATTPATPIDRLLISRLQQRGLSLQPEADRPTLIRRVTFDLTGLPPTPQEIQDFMADTDPAAYEKVVDRLLRSDRYGERMAADWLDVARYADSYGFQVDRDREMWPWRDWVIRAFNDNLPWDQFVTWQLAGDLLPAATDDQRLATAFNRLHQQEAEGGSVEEEYRVNYVNDRVTTFGTAFLGLTLECCRCHDHKFDPITQREFYQFFAFFDDIDEAGLYSFFTPSMPTPTLALRTADQKVQLAEVQAAVKLAEQQLSALRQERHAAFAEWLTSSPSSESPSAASPSTAMVDQLAEFSFDARGPDGKFASSVGEQVTASSAGENKLAPGHSGQAVQLTGDHAVTTNLGNFHSYEPFSVSLWLQTPDVKDRAVIFHRSRAWTDAASRGYELLLEDGRLKWSLIHFWPGDAISIRTVEPVPLQQWLQVTVTSDGSGRADDLRIFINGQPARAEVIRDHLTRDITGGGGDNIAIGERFRDRGFKDGLVDDFRVFGRALTALEISDLYQPGIIHQQVKVADALADDQQAALLETYLARHDKAYRSQLKTLQAARQQVVELSEAVPQVMVMQEMATPKPAYILKRGEYNLRGETVQPDTPAALPAFPADLPHNRLGLARWVTDPQHPLLARVTVNRVWQACFGLGLVKTSEDFGSQSDRPEYPELLDWLSRDFIDRGWDMKRLWKTVVMSRTYRQQSTAAPKLLAEDPENRWLARGPQHRLPAEMIRDNALAVSGLLVEKQGGPPVRTYDLPESFKPTPAGTGEQLYRRSLYTYWKRSGPAPVLEAFDIPKRQVCVVRRDTTNTPLHAFVLLNGPQFVEAARVLAETLHQEYSGDVGQILRQAFVRLTSHAPDDAQLQILTEMFTRQRDWYQQHPEAAAEVIKVGEKPAASSVPVVDLAALTQVVNALLSYDGCVMKR